MIIRKILVAAAGMLAAVSMSLMASTAYGQEACNRGTLDVAY